MTRSSLPQVSRRRLLGGVGMAGLAGLAACTGRDQTAPPLRFASAEPDERARSLLDEALTAFTERTGRAVRLETAAGNAYPDVLAQDMATGDPPDLVLMPTADGSARQHLAEHAGSGRLQPLEAYTSDPLDLADIPESAAVLGQVGGLQYAVPASLTVMGMHLVPEQFDRAGVDQPDGPITWDQFFDLCVRIGTSTPETTFGANNQLGLRWEPEAPEEVEHLGAVGYDFSLLEHWLRQRRRALFTEDGQLGFGPEDLTEWFTYWTELAAAGGCPVYEGFRTNRQYGAWGDAEAAFWFGQVEATGYLYPGPPFDELLAMEPPHADTPDAVAGQAYTSGYLLAIPAGASDPDASADLLRALVLDPQTATPLYGRVFDDHFATGAWNGTPPAARVREAVTAQDPPSSYQAAVALVIELGDQGGDPPAIPPASAPLVLDELSYDADQVGKGEVSIADGVDAFFTAVPNLL